jgi:hypothetical protein
MVFSVTGLGCGQEQNQGHEVIGFQQRTIGTTFFRIEVKRQQNQ